MAVEALALPGMGIIFAGLGAITVGAILLIGLIDSVLMQWTSFFIISTLWTIILWKPLMKSHSTPGTGYSDMVGETAVVGATGLSKGKVGDVHWSGAIMNARLVEESWVDKVDSGSEVTIVKISGGILDVAPKPGK